MLLLKTEKLDQYSLSDDFNLISAEQFSLVICLLEVLHNITGIDERIDIGLLFSNWTGVFSNGQFRHRFSMTTIRCYIINARTIANKVFVGRRKINRLSKTCSDKFSQTKL